METKKFIITGLVYGNLWGGGQGAYPAETLQGDDLEKTIARARELLGTGGLDSGMGFESLKGAYLEIETITTMEIEGKEFTNSEFSEMFIGDLTPDEEDFLQCGY